MIDLLGGVRPLSIAVRPPTGSAPSVDEPRLMERFRSGDESAFEQIYRREEGRLYAFALRLAQRPDEAADLVQGVFVKAWEHRRRIESVEHLSRWLRRVVVNDWINGLRRPRVLSLEPVEEGEPSFDPPAPPVRRSTIRLDLERAIATLSPRLRAVFLLFDLHGHNHEEIAGLLGITAGASKVQLHRARTKLKEVLG
ncbi:MAG: RNA polymerase sigma factor [Thermoanaerobaculia bacterium]